MARSRPRVESKSCSGWRVTISYVNLICWQGSLRTTYAYTCSTSHIYRPLQFKPWDALCPREPSRQRSRQKVITRSTERTAIQHSKFDHCNYTTLRKPLAIDATPAKISAQRMSLASTCTGFENHMQAPPDIHSVACKLLWQDQKCHIPGRRSRPHAP